MKINVRTLVTLAAASVAAPVLAHGDNLSKEELASLDSAQSSVGSTDNVVATTSLIRLAAADPVQRKDARKTGTPGILEEIVVTAQKREEKMKDVPLSLSAVAGEDLLKRNINDALSLSYSVPSLGAYQVSPGQNLLQIRGISGFRGGSSLVGLYMDEIPVTGGIRLGDASGLNVQTFDLARVEVLKGPQGTLFGEGSMGGVIRYVTNDPQLDRIEGRVMTSYFNTRDGDGSAQASGIVNLPLVDGVFGVRIVGTYENNGGWIDNTGSGKDDYNDSEMTDVRVKALYAPTEALKVSFLAEINRLEADGTTIVNVSPFDRSEFVQAVDRDASTELYNHFNIYNLTASYDFGFATLLSSTSHFDVKVNPLVWRTQVVPGSLEILGPRSEGTQSTTSQEFRLTSNGAGPFKWLAGANYKKSTNDIEYGEGFGLLVTGGTPIFGLAAGYAYRDSSEAVTAFADGSYTFFDRLEIGGGVRVFEEDKSFDQFQAPTGLISAQDGKNDKITYRVFVKYRLTDAMNLYANTATGFRSGGFNGVLATEQGAPLTVDPETSEFYEVGLKSVFLNGRIAFDLAAFKGKFKDQIQDVRQDVPGSVPIQYSVNSGVAEIEGIEWALNVIPVTGLNLSISGDVTDSEFTDVTALAPVIVGDPIDFVPEYNVMFSADYEFEWTPRLPGYINVSSTWKGSMQYTNRNTGIGPVIDQNSMLHFLQASVGMQWNGFDFTIFGRNLLDERDRLTPQFTGMWPQARPRHYGVTFAKSF